MSQSELHLTRADVGRDRAVIAVCHYHDGLITEAEMTSALDAIKVRGVYSPRTEYATGVKPAEYLGYDYAAQRWLHITP